MQGVYRKERSHGLFIIYLTSLDPPLFFSRVLKNVVNGF